MKLKVDKRSTCCLKLFRSKIVVKNKLTVNRVILVASLVFLFNFLTPLHTVLTTGVWPTSIQLAECVVKGLLQAVVVLMGLLKINEEEKEVKENE